MAHPAARFRKYLLLVGLFALLLSPSRADALTANRVEFEFHVNFYRVVFQYTIPELKEFREAMVEFRDFKKANAFYWKLLRGADFYLKDATQVRFINRKARPSPW